MLVSILIPSRDRPDQLINSIKCMVQTACDPDNIEFCIRMDEDDEPTLDTQEEIKKLHSNIKIIVGPRLDGYESLHIFYEELCQISEGTFFYLWNDDATMLTEAWDLIISDYQYKYCWIMTGEYVKRLGTWQTSFPCMHRKLWEITGRFSNHCHNDYYQHLIFRMFDNFWTGFQKFSLEGREPPHQLFHLTVNCMNGGPHQESEIIEIGHHALAAELYPEQFREHQPNWPQVIKGDVFDDCMKLLKYFVNADGNFKVEG